MRKIYGVILGCLILVAVVGLGITSYFNQPAKPWDGIVCVSDNAKILSSDEEKRLTEVMGNVSQYGNVVFLTSSALISDMESYAYDYYLDMCGMEPGVILFVDMSNRYIYMHTLGSVNKVITRNKALVITDNVYKYASAGDYYKCAAVAFNQALETLEGKKIPEPMRYITNGCLALVISLFVNYILVVNSDKRKKRKQAELIKGAKVRYHIENATLKLVHSSVIESDDESSGSFRSSGSSGSRRSGRSAGSRRSGSGGGHRF